MIAHQIINRANADDDEAFVRTIMMSSSRAGNDSDDRCSLIFVPFALHSYRLSISFLPIKRWLSKQRGANTSVIHGQMDVYHTHGSYNNPRSAALAQSRQSDLCSLSHARCLKLASLEQAICRFDASPKCP